MRVLNWLLFSLVLIFSFSARAEEDIFGESEDPFGIEEEKKQEEKASSSTISAFLESRLTSSVLRNIQKQEKVFCYVVDYAVPPYEGYVIHDLAVKGSCGELSDEGKKIITDAVLNNNGMYSNNTDNCQIKPKIMLRFVNGIDYTDVLFSFPCPSLTFFHDRDIITINAAPGKEIIEKISNAYFDLNEKFLSPALLGQLVGNGQVVTQDQKEIVRRLSPTEAPLKKWGADTGEAKPTPSAPAKASGWNKLK